MPSRSDTRAISPTRSWAPSGGCGPRRRLPRGSTLAALAESCGRDEEETPAALVTAACEGFVVTDLLTWRPAEERDR
jgi:hypothetical protein